MGDWGLDPGQQHPEGLRKDSSAEHSSFIMLPPAPWQSELNLMMPVSYCVDIKIFSLHKGRDIEGHVKALCKLGLGPRASY